MMNAGPRFSDVMQEQPAANDDALSTATPPTQGVTSNNASTEAILTNPIQQARVQVEMSRQRLQRLAMQLKAARNVL